MLRRYLYIVQKQLGKSDFCKHAYTHTKRVLALLHSFPYYRHPTPAVKRVSTPSHILTIPKLKDGHLVGLFITTTETSTLGLRNLSIFTPCMGGLFRGILSCVTLTPTSLDRLQKPKARHSLLSELQTASYTLLLCLLDSTRLAHTAQLGLSTATRPCYEHIRYAHTYIRYLPSIITWVEGSAQSERRIEL